MADVQPLRALHYDPAVAGPLQDVVAPPYDVIDASQRAELIARSPLNVVGVDLPQGEPDPYAAARELFESWQLQGALVRDAAAGAVGALAGLHRPGRRSGARAAASSAACASRATAPAACDRTSARIPGPRRIACA